MSWGVDEWQAFCTLIDEAWPGDFDAGAEEAWRTLLDDVEPVAALAAMKRLLVAGNTFRPSVAELMGEMRRDPSKPTFDEMMRLVYGQGGVLKARATGTYRNATEQRAAQQQARVDAMNAAHPLVGSFVDRQGFERLSQLPIHDPEYGELRRKELKMAWDAHVDACDGREVFAIAAGTGAKGLRKLDPLAALPRPQTALSPGSGD